MLTAADTRRRGRRVSGRENCGQIAAARQEIKSRQKKGLLVTNQKKLLRLMMMQDNNDGQMRLENDAVRDTQKKQAKGGKEWTSGDAQRSSRQLNAQEMISSGRYERAEEALTVIVFVCLLLCSGAGKVLVQRGEHCYANSKLA